MYTPQQALEAIKARINGEWDNPQLLKLGALNTDADDSESDVLQIIEKVDAELQYQNYRILVIQHLKKIDTQPAKVKIIREWPNQNIIIPYSNASGSPDPLVETAIKHLTERGFEIIGTGKASTYKRYLISTNNKSIL